MRIVFDGRLLGNGFGIGVYALELIKNLTSIGSEHSWFILVRPAQETLLKTELAASKNIKIIPVDIPHYSWAEQLRLPGILSKLKPDIVHFPNFNVPIFYKGKFVVTIHDVVHHLLPGHRRGRAYKRAAYRIVIKKAIVNSKAIISVSKSSKQDILKFFPEVSADKVFVISEGVDKNFNSRELPGEIYALREKYGITQPYILFVGVWEVKKNLPFLASVFAKLAESHSEFPELKLVLAGSEDPWHPEVKDQVKEAAGKYWDQNRILAPGFVEQADLASLYRHAAVFVNPSVYEGFGLPGLESIACGIPIAVADTPVFREVYGDAAMYFDARSVDNAVSVISGLLKDGELRDRLRVKGLETAAQYSWQDAASRTLQLYEGVVSKQ